jgi:polar amino acid transport system substrate-binding protein/two-component system sensor histidine kinase EvgS
MRVLFLCAVLLFSWLEAQPNFTEEEKAYIKNNPKLILGADYSWAPYDFADAKGQHRGIAADVLELVSQRSGLEIEVVPDRWYKTLQRAKNREFDGLSCAVKTPKRQKYFLFTKPYVAMPLAIITLLDEKNIRTIEDLKGKIVAVNEGSYLHEWLQKNYPEIRLLLSSSNDDALEEVSVGNANAYIGNVAVASYIIKHNFLANLKIVNKIPGLDTKVSIAIDKSKKTLFSIMEKSLDDISQQEYSAIIHKWFDASQLDTMQTKLSTLTQQERNWIQKHKIVRYSAVSWEPLVIVEDGHVKGLFSDYLDLISQRTGLVFEYKRASSWDTLFDDFKQGEIDIIPGVAPSEAINSLGVMSDVFASFNFVFVTKREDAFVDSLEDFKNKKLAVVSFYRKYKYLPKLQESIKVVETDSVVSSLEMVKSAQVDAFLGHMASAMYSVGHYYPQTLQIASRSDFTFKHAILLHQDQKILLSIINKALASINDRQKQDIANRWISVQVNEAKDYTLMMQIAVVLLVLILLSLYWNAKLSKEVHARKKIQKALQKAKEEAEAANRSKSEFLANMSHEIRTPMNAILGFTELLEDQVREPRLLNYIQTIQSAGNTLLLLINDILDLSKIEANKLQLQKYPTDLYALCNEVGAVFSMSMRNKGLELYIDIDTKIPRSILIDGVRLRQVLFNLIGNAVKFTHKGFIKLKVSALEIYDHNSKVDLLISVEDTGVGIEASQLESIFEVFEQRQGQDNRKYGGTGLGLTISKRLTEMMGGEIFVKSKERVGSEFIVKLYSIDISSMEAENSELARLRKKKKLIEFAPARVLVADDIADNRALIINNFADTPIEVESAQNGQEALNMFRVKRYDLVIMDIRMPVMDGYTAAKEMKKMADIPIIALTASVMQGEFQDNKLELFDAYLQKPVLKRDLFEAMSKFLRHTTTQEQMEKSKSPLTELILDDCTFIKALIKEVVPASVQAEKTHSLGDIKLFLDSLRELLKNYPHLDILREYVKEFDEAIKAFNVVVIQKLLYDFTDFLKQLPKCT